VTSFDETFSRELVFFWPQETDDFILKKCRDIAQF